jgi:hypothetical protein
LLQEEDITHVVNFEQEVSVGNGGNGGNGGGTSTHRAVFQSHHLDIKLDTMESILHELLTLKEGHKSQTSKAVPHLTFASSLFHWIMVFPSVWRMVLTFIHCFNMQRGLL